MSGASEKHAAKPSPSKSPKPALWFQTNFSYVGACTQADFPSMNPYASKNEEGRVSTPGPRISTDHLPRVEQDRRSRASNASEAVRMSAPVRRRRAAG